MILVKVFHDSTKLVLLANGNRYEVDPNTFFFQAVKPCIPVKYCPTVIPRPDLFVMDTVFISVVCGSSCERSTRQDESQRYSHNSVTYCRATIRAIHIIIAIRGMRNMKRLGAAGSKWDKDEHFVQQHQASR